MALFASIAFWVLLWFGRNDLEPKWVWSCIGAWVVALAGSPFVPGGRYFFMTLVALLDIGLILAVFGGDIEIH